MKQGLIHIYTGNGKGKTTAALGLILRACGRGMNVILVQFLKNRDTGELHALNKLNGVTVLRNAGDFAFFSSAADSEKEEIRRQNNANLTEAFRLANEKACDLIALDEIFPAYENGALDKALADKFILEKPVEAELILTGRNAPPHFIEAADYVTESVKIKHPYDLGVKAREGIEF